MFWFVTRSRSWALLTWRAAVDLVHGRFIAQSNDSSRILTYPPFWCDGMSWSKNHVMPISTRTFRSGRSYWECHQRPAVWKALPTASVVSPVLDHSCSTHFLGEVDWCSTDYIVSWCPRLHSIPNLIFQAHLRASHHWVPFLCFEWNLWW